MHPMGTGTLSDRKEAHATGDGRRPAPGYHGPPPPNADDHDAGSDGTGPRRRAATCGA
jgi:hypothetical protein